MSAAGPARWTCGPPSKTSMHGMTSNLSLSPAISRNSDGHPNSGCQSRYSTVLPFPITSSQATMIPNGLNPVPRCSRACGVLIGLCSMPMGFALSACIRGRSCGWAMDTLPRKMFDGSTRHSVHCRNPGSHSSLSRTIRWMRALTIGTMWSHC